MKEYHKIESVFQRDMKGTRKLIEGAFNNPAVEYLANSPWTFTEKIDGTNIRVHWDGHKVSFGGRTDKAVIPAPLYSRLDELFGGSDNEQIFEQLFGEKEATLYGEGYGEKIQAVGGLYRSGVDFILFDVLVGDIYLERDSLHGIANAFGINVVPVILVGTIAEAVAYVKSNPISTIGNAPMEGLVGKPSYEVRDRLGRRIVIKVKARDFESGGMQQ